MEEYYGVNWGYLMPWLVFITTLCGCVWRFAITAAKIEKLEGAARKAHDRLDVSEKLQIQLSEELSRRISCIEVTQGRMEEKINFICEKIKNTPKGKNPFSL